MHRYWLVVLCFLSACPVLAASNLLPHSLLILTNDARPVTNVASVQTQFAQQGRAAAFTILSLDAVKSLQKHFGEELPNDPTLAKAALDLKIESTGQAAFEQAWAQAYQALVAAMRYRITQYPAMIFDSTYVIYGVGDLAEGLQRYRDFMAKEGQDETTLP